MLDFEIYLGDCVEAVESLPSSVIDLTVTSPPYDGIRDYGGSWSLDLPRLGRALLPATAEGGICAMVIQDGTEAGAKTGTTARTTVSWMDAGWRLWETMIWKRPGTAGAWWNKRFRVDHEFILVFLKGDRPRFFNKDPLKVPAKWAGTMQHGAVRGTDGSMVGIGRKPIADLKCRGTVWENAKSNTERNKVKSLHPATFPDSLAEDLIECFSREGDTVFDPFAGSGTTLLAASRKNRHTFGCEINPEYVKIIETLRNG